MTAHATRGGLAPSRRALLGAGAGLGLVFMASPAFASPGGDERPRLVVIVCRGALDGLSLSPPVGDPDYAGLRDSIAVRPDEALALDGHFALHPRLSALHAMATAGQARLAPAVAIPERIRSHFEAQDLLESGGAHLYGLTNGWLNRALGAQAPDRKVQAIAIGAQEPLILRGAAPVQSWSPGAGDTPDLERLTATLQHLYAEDPALGQALASGLRTQAAAASFGGAAAGEGMKADVAPAASVAARFLAAPDGPSVAVLSLDGFDTHAGQGGAKGLLANRLGGLDATLGALQAGLGPAWRRTVVVAVTEFGRTAHVNGTGGTDHGTASTLILAGGALKPGGIVGDWPTLQPAKLFESRDLAPTLDMRQVFKGVLRDHMGLERAALDTRVFPESKAAPALPGLV